MVASKVKAQTLREAAGEIGVEADITSMSDTRHRIKLYPHVPDSALTRSGKRRTGERGDAPYQRTSASMFYANRRVNAVCWHGFRDFFRAVYKREPNAVFRTALDTWRGSEDFEARYRDSGHKNIGSLVAPVCTAEACRCGEKGMAV